MINSQLIAALLQPKNNFSITLGVANALSSIEENSIGDGALFFIDDLPIDHKLGLIVMRLNARIA